MALPQRYWEQAEKDVYTEDDYFEFESTSFGRWEFVNGGIHQMADGAFVPRRCRV